MGRWARDRAPLIVGWALVGGAIVWTVWAYRLPTAERTGALVVPGFVMALAGVLVGAISLLASLGRRPSARPVNTLAALLADEVDGLWRQTAIERRLLTPEPIPIRWSLSNLPVTGSVAVAVGTPDRPPAFPPLPLRSRITEAELQAGGGRAELHNVYAGLASGRVIVVGAPGAGKSGTAILLLLDALAHRDRLDDMQRARTPVPVLFTAHGWDPNACTVRDWLRDQLTATYPLFAHRGGGAEAAALVAAQDKVALILDGLDEMSEALRPVALQALNDAPFRVVVLTRSEEMVQAASGAWLAGAVAVHLHDIAVADGVDYLQRAHVGPPPAGWMDLLNHLSDHPDSVLARGLSTPLTLTLVRDTYRTDDDARALLDFTRYPTADAIEQHLISRVLPAAYTPQSGRPPPCYSEQQARQTLRVIARKMGKERNLAWWHISRWAPITHRILAIRLVVGLVFGLVFWCVFDVIAGLAFGPVDGRTVGLVGGFGFGVASGLAGGPRSGSEPLRVKTVNWRALISRRLLGQPLVLALVVGLIFGFKGGPSVGLAAGFTVGLASGLLNALTERGTGIGLPVSPRQAWRNDRTYGLVFGLTFGLMCGLTGAFLVSLGGGSGLMDEVAAGLTVGLMLGLLTGLHITKMWPTTLVWLYLQLSRQVAAVILIPFLEDARERGILRTAGAVYQFRHAKLQDQLADQGPANSFMHSTAPRPHDVVTSPTGGGRGDLTSKIRRDVTFPAATTDETT